MTRKEYRAVLNHQAESAKKILNKALTALSQKDFAEIPPESIAVIISVAKLLQNDCTIEENVLSEVVMDEVFGNAVCNAD